jgi:diguanylate cyclase
MSSYAQAIEAADSLDSLAAAVREMLDESRTVHALVTGARDRLAAEHARASALESRVLGLEADLRRLSDEVSTDALTQVANRRGLTRAFEQETARVLRDGADQAPLAVGLIDIDNFKKLNDSLGHAAGDVALQNLAARVKEWLRPVDHIARFGGEEFVLLLPGTPVDEAQQILTRLQRRLSASLFMHEGKEVFVTFSAGVTADFASSAFSPSSACPPHLPRRGSTTLSVMNQMMGVNRPTIARINHQLPKGFMVQVGSMMRAASWVKPNKSTSSWPGVILPA